MTQRKLMTWAMIFSMIFSLVIPAGAAQAQVRTPNAPRGQGQVKASFQAHQGVAAEESLETTDAARPAWVNRAATQALGHFDEQKERYGMRDARQELKLLAAEQDDLGQTHLRLKQTRNEVEIFGLRLIAHVQGNTVKQVSGRTIDASAVDTTPAISAEQAVDFARTALGFVGDFASEPTARLVILPHTLFDEQAPRNEASLTYQVSLLIEDGSEASANHQYFVDAADGRIVWHFDAMTRDNQGKSLYSGTVTVATAYVPPSGIFGPGYRMQDTHRANNLTEHANGRSYDTGDVNHFWGDGTATNDETAAVDAQWGVAKAWDYFQTAFGRNGWDNQGFEVTSLVHVGSNLNNAFQSGNGSHNLNFGDGDGSTYNPFVSLDVVAHEFTHGVTEHTAGLIYANESGALNESFSDIFGTATEFAYGAAPNYLMGDQIMRPGAAKALRDMADPATLGQPDNYSNRVNASGCTPSNANDQCGVHTNSGIMNNAFYLLAEGGTNKTSKRSVSGIGRRKAEIIFYRALTLYLFPGAKFYDARIATVNAAEDLYGPQSNEARATAAAWDAVGVNGNNFMFYNAYNGSGAVVQVTPSGGLNQLTGFGTSTFSLGWTAIVPSRDQLFFYQHSTGLYAVAKVDQNGGVSTTDSGFIAASMDFVISTDNSIFLLSNSTHTGVFGQIDQTGKFKVTQSFANAFASWTSIVDTKYGMFFYNSTNGSVAVGNASAAGQWTQTFGQANALPTGYDIVVAQGANILLYNSNSTDYALGVVNSAGKFLRTTITSCGSALPTGYNRVVATGSQLFFYNQFTGAAAVGQILSGSRLLVSNCWGQLSLLKTYPAGSFSAGWTTILPTVDGILFYNFLGGGAAVGHLNPDGSFTQTANARYSSLWSNIVPLEK